MDCSTPGFPVHQQLLELAQTQVHWVGDAIQPSHPLSSPSSLPQSFAESGSFPMSLLFTSGGQSLVASALASVLPINIQGWFPLGLTGLISLLSRGLSRVFQHHSSKASILWCSVFFMVQLSHLYLTTRKIIALTRWTFERKEVPLPFNTLCRFVIAFLPRSKSLNFVAAVTVLSDFGDQKTKTSYCFHFFLFYLLWSDGTGCLGLGFLNVEF